ncbi:hypothetical protein GCM10010112_66870 [Actinoplanes lobatus]|uniref:Uncharacterized protein n=1 Tax=Actinoplanes lobatus TaxID=113568 RepID=A0A7W7HI64_9ACTN|nr:hypothetical protein [Actinoplanes lobatus]MBB4750985.1 hypothetical protein [Actinoplanes lobatus]GGN85914.1 hypothetical protein GCM10010112_66870 [Actinoplanes lobatus]
MDMSAVVLSIEIARRDVGSALPHAPVLPHRPRRNPIHSAAQRLRRLLRGAG